MQQPCSDYVAAAVQCAVDIHCADEPGDILIFLTGQQVCVCVCVCVTVCVCACVCACVRVRTRFLRMFVMFVFVCVCAHVHVRYGCVDMCAAETHYADEPGGVTLFIYLMIYIYMMYNAQCCPKVAPAACTHSSGIVQEVERAVNSL